MNGPAPPPASEMSEERLRAGVYALLANLLAATPADEMLDRLEAIAVPPGGERLDAMAEAWAGLKLAAQQARTEAIGGEYHDLFIGLGRGELAPYGSWYLTGFLLEKPLGQLRRDLADLGYERRQDEAEPEDHAAALCEVMALLVMDEAVSLNAQRAFFDTHVGSWLERFFQDLEAAKSARFYRAVGRLGRAFMALEQRYLAMKA